MVAVFRKFLEMPELFEIDHEEDVPPPVENEQINRNDLLEVTPLEIQKLYDDNKAEGFVFPQWKMSR